jgi:DNA-binding CsgD family transcriptional regulator
VSLRAPATASRHAKCSSAQPAELQQLGAIRHRDAAERELRLIGHCIHRRSRPSAAEATGIASVTRIVDRQANRQIADELFLGTKTGETHICNIFGKLGAASRIEVARWSSRPIASRHRTSSAHPRQLPESIDPSGRRPRRPARSHRSRRPHADPGHDDHTITRAAGLAQRLDGSPAEVDP